MVTTPPTNRWSPCKPRMDRDARPRARTRSECELYHPTNCDPDSKYWCFKVDWTPYTGYVSVDTIEYTGGLGGGSTRYQALMERLYREDPSTSIDYLLTDYGPTSWYTDNAINSIFHNTSPGYLVSDWAITVVQDKHQSNVSPYGYFCGDEVDFWLSGPSGPAEYETGGAGPC